MAKFIIVLLALLFAVPAIAQTPVTICNQPKPSQSICGGSLQTHILSTASTNSNLIGTAVSHILFDIVGINTNATTAFLKFYDKAVAPTCNTDVVLGTYPLIQNIPVVVSSQVGKQFSLGIGLCITAGIADNDNANATTGIAISLAYK